MGFGTLGDHIFARIWKLTSAAVTRTLTRQLDGPWVVSIFTYLTRSAVGIKVPILECFSKGHISPTNTCLILQSLECKYDYSATLNNTKLVHWMLMGGCGWEVTFGTAKGLGGAAARPGPSSLYQM